MFTDFFKDGLQVVTLTSNLNHDLNSAVPDVQTDRIIWLLEDCFRDDGCATGHLMVLFHKHQDDTGALLNFKLLKNLLNSSDIKSRENFQTTPSQLETLKGFYKHLSNIFTSVRATLHPVPVRHLL